MAKKRYINTKFWSDDFIIGLKPMERYFFLYLLTNEHTDICGIYELSLRVIERETDLSEKQIIDILSVLKPKIAYIDGWVHIKNFEKHQAVNPKVIEGVKRSKEVIPKEILAKLSNNDIDYDSLSKTTIETELLSPTLSLSPTPKLKSTPKDIALPDVNAEAVKEILNIFYEINPSLNFGNKTYRSSAQWLIDKYGLEKITAAARYAISIQGEQYAPQILNPHQLKEKMTALTLYKQKQQPKGLLVIG